MPERSEEPGLGGRVTELRQLVVTYVVQETWGPLKSLGRFVLFGVAGSLLLVVGVSFWLLAVLRALQTETGATFTGHLTWIPYAVCTAGALALAAGAVALIFRGAGRARASRAEEE